MNSRKRVSGLTVVPSFIINTSDFSESGDQTASRQVFDYTERETETERHRERERDMYIDIYIERERDREREIEIHIYIYIRHELLMQSAPS